MGLSTWKAVILLFSLVPSALCTQKPPSNATTALFPFPADLCAISSWPTHLPGKVYTPQLPDSELTSILNQIDPLRIKAIIEKLVSFGTRHTQSSQTDPERGVGAARDWLLGEYRGFAEDSGGVMTVQLQR